MPSVPIILSYFSTENPKETLFKVCSPKQHTFEFVKDVDIQAPIHTAKSVV